MPIFDEELFPTPIDRENAFKAGLVQSPTISNIDTGMGGFGEQPKDDGGIDLEDIDKLVNTPDKTSWDSPVQMIPQSELLENKRYGMYQRDLDLEQYHALAQSGGEKFWNSLIKMGATAAGTFAQGFGTIPNAISAIRSGNFKELSDPDGYESSIDNWLKNLEDKFPNYYTHWEQEHPFKSALPWSGGFANFWGDKVLKNLGFTIGAIGSAVAQDAIITGATGAIGDIPLVSAQIAKASSYLSKLFARTSDIGKVLEGVEGSVINVEKLAQLARNKSILDKMATGSRYAIGLYSSSAAEAGIEARDGYRQVKQELIRQYKDDHLGEDPSGIDLDEINKYAEDAMNVRFGINMALLTVSNAIQFDGLLRTFKALGGRTVEGSLARTIEEAGKIGLKEGSLDTFEKKVPGSIAGRVWESIRPTLPEMFSEGVYEEGGQYAAERGTYDYYTRKYTNLNNPKNRKNWDVLSETLHSSLYGLQQQFGTDEGMENMVLGALTAVITGGAKKIVDNTRGVGKNARLAVAVNTLNSKSLTGTLTDKYTDAMTSSGILQDMKEANKKGDVFKYKNLNHDMFFSYVMSRIPQGLHDVTIDQLENLKDLKKEDFEKTFSVDFNKTNKSTVDEYVDGLIKKANDIKKIADDMDVMFKNPFNSKVNPKTDDEIKENFYHKTFNDWKTDLTYLSSVPQNINERLQSINNDITKINPLLTNDLLAMLTSDKGLNALSKEYAQRAKTLSSTINDAMTPSERRKINRQVKALETLSQRAAIDANGKSFSTRNFNELLNFELNNQDLDKAPVVPLEKASELINYGVDVNRASNLKNSVAEKFDALSSKEGFEKYIQQAEEVANEPIPEQIKPYEFINEKNKKEILQENREYENPKIKKAYMKDNVVHLPDGTIEKYDTKEEALNALEDINKDISPMSKVRVLQLNPDGTAKVEDSSGNIFDLSPEELKGYSIVKTEEEKLAKVKGQLDKLQDKFQKDSGTIPTGNPEDEEMPEGKLKSAEDFFISTITESEDYNDPNNSAPHVKRAREFLNKAAKLNNFDKLGIIQVTQNQEEAYGLKGLTNLSYKGNVPENANDVDNGLVAAVFVEHEKGKIYFIDEEGKRIGELGKQVDLNNIIFQTMPTTAITYVDGSPRYRKGEQEEFEAKAKAWRKERKALFEYAGNPVVYKFNVSRGVANTIIGEKNHVGGVLIDEKLIPTQQGLIVIPKEDGIVSFNGKALKFPPGRPVLKYKDTLVFLNNTKLGAKRANVIYQMLNEISKNIIEQNDKNETIKINPQYISYIQNVMFYSTKKVGSDNKINIDTKTMTINIGNKSYRISEMGNNEEAIVNQLTDTFHSINDKSLKEDVFNQPFIEYVLEDGEIKEGKTWTNYQTYLLASDGRVAEQTPLVTNVAKPLDGMPSFKQKYATLIDFELPIQKKEKKSSGEKETLTIDELLKEEEEGDTIRIEIPKKKKEGKKVTLSKEDVIPTKIGEFTLDGKTVNSFKSKFGDIPFKAIMKKNVDIVVDTNIPKNILDESGLKKEQFDNAVKSYLEQQQKQEPEKGPSDWSNNDDLEDRNGRDEYFRKATEKDIERISSEEIKLFKEWAAKNVPNIPYEVLDNIIHINNTEKAWGVFENGVAKFYKHALKGTEYHEVFEGIWKSFLSPEQQKAIIDEFHSNQGTFTDRQTGQQINYEDATDLQAKERIADDFADFRLGKIKAKSLKERVLQFFRNIIEFFKSFVNKPSMKEQLFKAIDTGKFKEYKIPSEVTRSEPEYSRMSNIPETIAYEFVQDMTALTSQYIFGEDKKSLYDIKQITGQEIYNFIKDKYTEENKYQKIERSGEGNFDILWRRAKENLRTLGIKFDSEDKIDINDAETNNRLYAPEAFTMDVKKSSPYAIKFTCATVLTVKSNKKWKIGNKLPKPKESSQKGYLLNSFNRVFATLMDKLSNTTSLEKLNDKMLKLAETDPNYVSFFQRVGGNLATGEFSFSDFKYEDWRLFIDFFQTFTKQHPEADVQYLSNGETWIAPANQFTTSKEVMNSWLENIKALAADKKSAITYSPISKSYKANRNIFPASVPKEGMPMIKFLEKIGITFPIETYTRMSPSQSDRFADAVGRVYSYLKKVNDVASVKGKFLGVNGPLTTIASLYVELTNPNRENTYFGVDGERHQLYTGNNTASILENEFNESKTLDELIEKRPELNDVYSSNSVVLKKGGLFVDTEGNRTKELKISYIQGTKDNNTNKGLKTKRLSLGDRFVQEINNNLKGDYYILVPADSATEWKINLGNYITYKDIIEGKAFDKFYDVFHGYLVDEINLALDSENRKKLKNVGTKANELRFFKEILNSKDVNAIHQMIEDGVDVEEFENYIKENSESINSAIKNFVNSLNEGTKNVLQKSKKITASGENVYKFTNILDEFCNSNSLDKNKLSEEDVDNILTFVNMNYIINNTEMHKILFGDPYQFAVKKGNLDETKRIKLFLSPRITTFDSPEYNTHLNQNFNKVGNIQLTKDDVGWHEYKSYTPTVTLRDVSVANDIKGAPEDIRKMYWDISKEGDAFSIVIDTTYREIKQKHNNWGTENAEPWHQWQMAYTRRVLDKKGIRKYNNEALRKADDEILSSPESTNYRTEIIKPIVAGVKNGEKSINNVVDKFAQMPLYYKAVEGTNLEKLYIKMLNEGIGYVIFESGRKVGTEKLFDLYKPNGEFNTLPFDNIIDVPWKAYSIQVATEHEEEYSQTRGSQLNKISTLDLFENGRPFTDNPAVAEHIKKVYSRYTTSLDNLHREGYERLLRKLGLEDLGNSFRIVDNTSLSRALEEEMFRRELSENVKATVQLDDNGEFMIPFEASPAYKQIKDILFSMVNKTFVSPKMNGAMHTQAPVTLWENSEKGRDLLLKTDNGYKKITRKEYDNLSEEEKKKVRFGSSELRFYSSDHPYCEVMLPCWFKDKFRGMDENQILNLLNNTKEGKDILTGVAFRIPTQATSSIEVFRVKGFLPKSMGDTIVVPSEITVKAGSDFDIDKLNVYLKSVYIDENNKVRLVQYKGSEEATKKFYGNVFEKKILSKIERIEDYGMFRDKLIDILDVIQTLPEITQEAFDNTLTEEQQDFFAENKDILQETIDSAFEDGINPVEYLMGKAQTDEEKKSALTEELLSDKLRNNYINRMYRRSLENEHYGALEEILTLPEVQQRMLTPIGDAGLRRESERMGEITSTPEEKKLEEGRMFSNLLNRPFITNLRHAFVTGKRWIGIVAVNITGHSLLQKSKVYIDTEKFNKLKAFDRKFLGDGKIILPHNKVIINGKEYASYSGVKTHDGSEYISDRLSGYATSLVDIANDPYILKLILSPKVVDIFFFLERMGCGKNTIYFLNQPIIREYLKYLDSAPSGSLYNKANLEYIRGQFLTGNTKIEDAVIDIKNLNNNIEKYYSKGLTEGENAVQHKVLDEFLKYAKMANYGFKLSQALNYDTTRFRDADSFELKNARTNLAEEKNIFSSVNEVLDNNFIGLQKEYINSAMEAMGSVLKMESEQIRGIVNDVMQEYYDRDFLMQDDFDRIAAKLKASFMDYIIQSKTGLNGRIEEVVNSIAGKLEAAKRRHPGMEILNNLKIVTSNRQNGATSVKLFSNDRSASSENQYVDMMRELKQVEPELYQSLIDIALLQGNYQSSISIKNIIPIEDYSKVLKPIFDNLVADEQIRGFAEDAFQRNNFNDEDIFKTFTPKLNEEQYPSGTDEFGDPEYAYVSPNFEGVKDLGIKSTDRKLLFLRPQYNAMDLDRDYLKVKRIITVGDKKVDISTGRDVTSKIGRMAEKGDFSLFQIYGYKKVKYADGTPLITKTGQYVYKLINLWGDGQLASEYHTDARPSVFDNGTVKIENEILDSDLINYYAPKVTQKTIDPKTVEEKPLSLPEEKQDGMKIEPKGTINIYWGQKESPTSTRILSNLAPRKFTYESTDGVEREYGSVEHAYQSNKNGKFDKTTYDAYVKKGGYGVKIAPRLTDVGKRGNLQLMKDLVVESFIQNPNSEAAKKLLQYENFTHNTNQLIDKAFLEGLKLAQQGSMTKVDKSLSWGEIKNLPVYSEKGVNVMRKQNTNEHFGNPFTGTPSVAKNNPSLILMNSVEEAVQAYKDWLNQDIEKERRKIAQSFQKEKFEEPGIYKPRSKSESLKGTHRIDIWENSVVLDNINITLYNYLSEHTELREELKNILVNYKKEGKGEKYGSVYVYKLSDLPENFINKLQKLINDTNEFIAFKDINPKQQKWILSQIEQGKLDNKTLLYMKDRGEYYSHADALRDIVNNRKIATEQKNAPEGLPETKRPSKECNG